MSNKRLILFNRQPSLWSHSLTGMEIVPSDDDDDTIGVHPLSLEPFNADFDDKYCQLV